MKYDVLHHINDVAVEQRLADGYVNATAMCKAAGKLFADYARLTSTKEFLAELAKTVNPIVGLVQSKSGGIEAQGGTWVHPDIATHLAQWLSPKFAVAVARWVREWMTGDHRANLPYHLRRYLANRYQVPYTHFSVLGEMLLWLVQPLEDQGYHLPEKMVPDISEGRIFAKWLRDERGIDTDTMPTYAHRYEDGRVVQAKMYPLELLADFRAHFNEVWLPERSLEYFKERDPLALPHLKTAMAITAEKLKRLN